MKATFIALLALFVAVGCGNADAIKRLEVENQNLKKLNSQTESSKNLILNLRLENESLQARLDPAVKIAMTWVSKESELNERLHQLQTEIENLKKRPEDSISGTYYGRAGLRGVNETIVFVGDHTFKWSVIDSNTTGVGVWKVIGGEVVVTLLKSEGEIIVKSGIKKFLRIENDGDLTLVATNDKGQRIDYGKDKFVPYLKHKKESDESSF